MYRMITRAAAAATLASAAAASNAAAGDVTVVEAQARQTSDGVWRFDVTLRHSDTGWDHYADAWAVFGPDGTMLGQRILYHPHVDEQPFTRSLDGVEIEPGVLVVIVRGRDSQHGWSDDFELALERP